MKPKTLGILAAAALALAAFIAFYESKLPSTTERREQSKKAIVFAADQTREVVLETAAPAVRIRLQREASGSDEAPRIWWLREPLVARADGFAVDRFLQSLAALEAVRRLEDADREELGLNRPRYSATVRGEFGERTLDIGVALPIGGTVAVAVRGDRAAAVVAESVVADFVRPADDWRSRELFTVDRDQVESLTLSHEGRSVVIGRQGEVFSVSAPFVDRADRDRVNELLSELASLQASRFLPGEGEAAAGPFDMVVEVRVKNQAQPLRVEIGPRVIDAKPEKRRVRVDGVAAESETALAETLSRPPAGWRSSHWSSFEVFRVESLAAVTKGEPWDLARQGSDWKRGDQVLPYGPVSDLLYAVTTAKGLEILSRTEAANRGIDFARSQATFKLGGKEGEVEVLSLYSALTGGEVPAGSSTREVVLLLPAETAREILEKAVAVRSAEPLKGDTADE